MSDWLLNLSIKQGVFALLLFFVGLIVAKKLANLSEKYARKRFSKHHALLMRRIVYYITFVAFLISALQQLGFNLTVLIGAAGVLTVALSFASQTAASNLISGIFMIFEQPFSVDDFIEVKNFSGTVLSIDLLSTKLITRDNRLVRVPNETMIKSEIINYNAFKTRRIDLVIDISYEDNIAKARDTLYAIAESNSHVLKTPAVNVWVNELASSSIQLKLMVWVNSSDVGTTKSELQEAIKVEFDKQKINIPFPQLTLHRAD